jgi:hypothetical protein
VGLVSFARSTQTDITVAQTDTLTGAKAVETFTITDLSPSWSASGHYRGGMGIPAAARAAEMLADLVGGLTWDAYRDDPNEDLAHKVYPRPLVLEQPAPPRPLISTVVSMVMDYLWHGNAIGIKVGSTIGTTRRGSSRSAPRAHSFARCDRVTACRSRSARSPTRPR